MSLMSAAKAGARGGGGTMWTKKTIFAETDVAGMETTARYRARRTRLRKTAVFTSDFGTTAATRIIPLAGAASRKNRADKKRPRALLPFLMITATSAARKRRLFGSIEINGSGNYIARRLRPFRRRRASVFLPPAVRIRVRNPCDAARFLFFG